MRRQPTAAARLRPDTTFARRSRATRFSSRRRRRRFSGDVLRRALEIGARDGVNATDEAALVELAGLAVRLVDGEASNIKITTPEDMPLGEAIAAPAERPPARTGRAGTGYDLHRLVAGPAADSRRRDHSVRARRTRTLRRRRRLPRA